jgi:hypothetical protein
MPVFSGTFPVAIDVQMTGELLTSAGLEFREVRKQALLHPRIEQLPRARIETEHDETRRCGDGSLRGGVFDLLRGGRARSVVTRASEADTDQRQRGRLQPARGARVTRAPDLSRRDAGRQRTHRGIGL